MKALDREIRDLMQSVSEKIILPRFRNLSEHHIIEKAADDLVTVADNEAETELTQGLAKLDPSLAIVGEEAAHADASVLEGLSHQCWIVDPIDGTHNFAHGHGPFGILIAHAENGFCQSGWIYDCLTARFCHAHRGEGAFVNGEKVTARTTGETPPVAAIAIMFLDQARREAVKRHVSPHYRMIDIPRCAAEQYPRLALGQNDVSFFQRTLAWDHAAGTLWLEEAGGKVARLNGDPYKVDEWDRTGLIGAASPRLWQELADRMEQMN